MFFWISEKRFKNCNCDIMKFNKGARVQRSSGLELQGASWSPSSLSMQVSLYILYEDEDED